MLKWFRGKIVKRFGYIFLVIVILLITFFANFDGMKAVPFITGEEFLSSQPYITIGDIVLTQPSSTVIVYILGIFIILLGIRFLKKKQDYISRKWWGISMIFWGIGAILAGTSYQAFGYQLKCVGVEYCNFTDWWEIMYLLLTAVSIGMLAIAMSHCVASGKTRKIMKMIAYISVPLYALILTIGSIVPVKFMVTYELFCIFFMPQFVVFFILSIKEYKIKKDFMNKRFIITWILFLLTNVAYYVYYWIGISESLLNSTGIWFNQNDVLHVLLMGWMIYIWIALPNVIVDKDEVKHVQLLNGSRYVEEKR